MSRTKFTVSFEDGQSRSIHAKFVHIKGGVWLNEKSEKLTQSSDGTSSVLFGEKVKIKVFTDDAKDGKKVNVEVRAKIGDDYIDFTKDKEALKLTLTVKNDEAISEPFYLNPEWYNEEKEYYDYKDHQTKIKSEELLTFVFDAKFEGQKRELGLINLPKEDTLKLTPISYRRNYEELIGLFNTDNSGDKDKKQNYENKFIDNNLEIKTIVDEFIETVVEEDITISEIKTLVKEKAKALWDVAVKQVQGYTKTIQKEIIYSEKVRAEIGLENKEKVYEDTYINIKANLDDRPLYWARNKMQTWLKRNLRFKDQINFETSQITGNKLKDIIQLFEEQSRNYTGIDFSKSGSKKRVLITGFDPFQLDYGFYGKRGIKTFNPSGIIALALQDNKDLLKNNIFVQTCIFPVRYEDFDNEIVENTVKNHINSQLSILMTTSLNGSNPRFDIEKYAIEYRGGFHDNMCIGDYNNPKYDKSRFSANKSSNLTETTLPKSNIFGALNNIKLNGQSIHFDTAKSKTTGSGNNYLSNEVMYRTTKLRGNLKIPVGHFHLGNLGDIRNTSDTKDIVSLIIKKILS